MLDLEPIKQRRAAITEDNWKFYDETTPTAQFIFRSPADIDALVAEVERLRSMTTLSCGHSIAVLVACADGLDDEHTVYVCRECSKAIKEKLHIDGHGGLCNAREN